MKTKVAPNTITAPEQTADAIRRRIRATIHIGVRHRILQAFEMDLRQCADHADLCATIAYWHNLLDGE